MDAARIAISEKEAVKKRETHNKNPVQQELF